MHINEMINSINKYYYDENCTCCYYRFDKRYYKEILDLSRNCLISVYQLTFVTVEFKLLEERSNNCLPSSKTEPFSIILPNMLL